MSLTFAGGPIEGGNNLIVSNCGACGVSEGQLHQPGCDMEKCPFCGGQLISCDCVYEILGLYNPDLYGEQTAYLPPDIYKNGLSDDLADMWEKKLEEKGLVPFILYPIMCAKCGKLWPELFQVPSNEWQYYIQPSMRDKVICLDCYQRIKSYIEAAKKDK
jgi:hypothetical protein